SSVLNSAPVTINADGRLWKVNNYEGEYLGRINLTQAIAYSDNSVFSQLTALVGPRSVRDTARALGITTKLNGYFAIGLGGEPAAGGTFPALIWKAFMQKALAKVPPESFTPPDYGYAAPVTVVNRGGILERDDGVCRNTAQLEFFGGQGPERVATCKQNEVE